MATLQLTAGRPKDAVTTLQPMLDSQPSATALALAAEAYEADQDTPQAVKLLRQAIVQEPRNVDLYVQLADFDHAEADFETANELDPHLALSETAQGMVAQERNDPDKALAVVR